MYAQKSTTQRIIDQFLFTQIEILIQVVSSGLLILYSIYKLIEQSSQELRQFAVFSENTVTRFVSSSVGEMISKVATADVATMLLWALIGAVVYAIVNAGINTLRGAEFTIISTLKYKHPNGFSRGRFLLDLITEKVLIAIGMFVFILYSSSLVNTMIPYVYEQVSQYVALVSLKSFWATPYIIALVMSLHIWFVLLRLVRGLHKHDDVDLLRQN